MGFGHFLAKLRRVNDFQLRPPTQDEAHEAPPAGNGHLDRYRFLAVTGPKTDVWLVHTVGWLVLVVKYGRAKKAR